MSGYQPRESLDSAHNLDPIPSSNSMSPEEGATLNPITSGPEVPLKDPASIPLPSPSKDLPKSSPELLDDDKIKFVLNSDSALDVLLKRLKESITSCDEFAKFIKKKSAFQEEHDYQLKKLAKNTKEYLRHNSSSIRQDSFTRNFEQIVNFDERLHNVGYAYVTALQTMSDELFQLSATMQRQRRQLKDEGKRKEKDVADAILAAEKAKSRYDNFCVELEKVRTNEPTKKFSLKSKTTSQQEEELLVKIENADKDYSSKVAICKGLKNDLLNFHRPQNSKTLKDLILEIDLAMSVQLQKYVTWCENLLMNSGVLISPLRSDARQASMKSLAASVDNEKDLYEYLLKYQRQGPSRNLIPVDYKVHPTLVHTQANFNNSNINNTLHNNTNSNAFTAIKRSSSIFKKGSTSPVLNANNSLLKPIQDPSGESPLKNNNSNRYSYLQAGTSNTAPNGNTSANNSNLNINNIKTSSHEQLHPAGNYNSSDYAAGGVFAHDNRSQSALPSAQELSVVKRTGGDQPLIFGGPITPLCIYENGSVPLIVRTCINIIDTYGLELEGIYRTSGNSTKTHQLKEAINADRSMVHKLINNPVDIIDSDMYCIASLLKLYFAQLPEPLFPHSFYKPMLDAVKIADSLKRQKAIHEVVFQLPDANYFTLRALIFHLCRVSQKEEINRMSARNLGIIWGPNLLSSNHTNTEDMSYQGKVVEHLMYVVDNIFEPEELEEGAEDDGELV